MTQELIANVLRCEDPADRDTARKLPDEGAIRYTRGLIEVLNRGAHDAQVASATRCSIAKAIAISCVVDSVAERHGEILLRMTGSSTRFASHGHKHHAAAIDATSPAPDCLAERRQFAATVLPVCFGSCYRHVAASLLLRRLPLPRACGHCVIV
jgi:hypothetical protein